MGLVLRMAPTAWAKLRYMCTQSDTEIGGFGVSSSDDPLLVTEFHLIKQECTAATVELDDEALANYVEDQVELGRHPNECLRIWIHTHPGKDVTPSGTDWDMFKAKFTDCDWSVMAIMGSDGDTSGGHLWITHPESGFINLPKIEIDWTVSITGADPSDWQKELDDKVSTLQLTRTISSPSQKLYKTPSHYDQYHGYHGENFKGNVWQLDDNEIEDDDNSKPEMNSIDEESCFGANSDDGWENKGYYVYQ